jgi:signal transduction histidine kinase
MMTSGARLVFRNKQKSMRENMHMDRKPSTVMMIIDRIYHPIAQNLGVSLLLRNEINTEIQFPSNFFINLIQITGNLVANAIKYSSPNGFVDVVFNMDADEDHSSLKMTVTDTRKIISPDLVSAFNQSKQVATLIGADVEDSFGTRLEYVMQLISEEGGRIFVKSGKDSGTIFSLSFPLRDNYMIRMNGSHPVINNGVVLLNGS